MKQDAKGMNQLATEINGEIHKQDEKLDDMNKELEHNVQDIKDANKDLEEAVKLSSGSNNKSFMCCLVILSAAVVALGVGVAFI